MSPSFQDLSLAQLFAQSEQKGVEAAWLLPPSKPLQLVLLDSFFQKIHSHYYCLSQTFQPGHL
jgi:hypothetical protein